MSWNSDSFEGWLKAYGAAWEARDAAAFGKLFTDDCAYYWTPFDPPYVGPESIRGAFTRAVSTQSDIHFSHTILAVIGDQGIARWTCAFTRQPEGHGVRLDGVLLARAGADGTCREFREFWHRHEPAPR